MKRSLMPVLFLLLAFGPLWAAPGPIPRKAVLTSVSGKVRIQDKNKKDRTAQSSSIVLEGEHVLTGQDSKATLRMFDGSELKIDPKTDFQVTQSKASGTEDKILKFKLFVGHIFASVKKLASAKSSFEVEAGGVVCGVRGTRFGLEYDPTHHHVGLGVFEGNVYTHWNGHTNYYGAGQNANFDNGKPDNKGNGKQGDNGQGGKGKGGPGGPGALDDLSHQFTGGLTGNGNNTLTDPGVEGSVHLGVQIRVGPGEAVP